jgi:hypothetical protein
MLLGCAKKACSWGSVAALRRSSPKLLITCTRLKISGGGEGGRVKRVEKWVVKKEKKKKRKKVLG